jgi:MOSC domain-containing protein YiiM
MGLAKSNYDMYRDDLLDMPDYAMFGENLTIEDLDESNVYFHHDLYKLVHHQQILILTITFDL